MKKIIGIFVILIALFMLPTIINAKDVDTDELIKKVAPDGENAVVKMKTPTTPEEQDFVATGYFGKALAGEGYNTYAFCDETTCEVTLSSTDFVPTHQEWDSKQNKLVDVPGTGWSKTYNLKVTYDEPAANQTITDFIDKLNEFDSSNPETYYEITDLSLINYYLTSDKSELWNPGAPGRALKYSNIIDLTKGSDISYYLDIRAGSQDETLMFESAIGEMTVFYNGYAYGRKQEGVYLKRVIYIPDDTANTTDAYIEAAQKRINEYLGNDNLVKVTLGGTLASLPDFSEDEEYPVEGNDGNYYNVKVGERTYKFYLIKSSADKLVNPTYLGLNLETNIEINSTDSSIPLDTTITVKNISNDTFKDIIGTENYKSYDISLYSDAKGNKIEKLENGKFQVKIPVPTELEGKELIVYYIATDDTKEEHQVTIKDGYAIFETNHFSTYTLAEKVPVLEEETPISPKTNDQIHIYVITLIFSILCAILLILSYKKINV